MSQAIYNSSLEVEASSLRNKIETKIGKKKHNKVQAYSFRIRAVKQKLLARPATGTVCNHNMSQCKYQRREKQNWHAPRVTHV
jgi:hypothetical protein